MFGLAMCCILYEGNTVRAAVLLPLLMDVFIRKKKN
jgi:hypothetical protein